GVFRPGPRARERRGSPSYHRCGGRRAPGAAGRGPASPRARPRSARARPWRDTGGRAAASPEMFTTNREDRKISLVSLADALRVHIARRLERGAASPFTRAASGVWGAIAARRAARRLELPRSARVIGVGSAVL